MNVTDMSFDETMRTQEINSHSTMTEPTGGTAAKAGKKRKKHHSRKHRSSSSKKKKHHGKKRSHSGKKSKTNNGMNAAGKVTLSSKGSGKRKKKLLDYECVQAYQTRSIGCSDMLLDPPLTPPEYFPSGNVKSDVTVRSLALQGVTPRMFFLNYVGWVAHPKDKAPRAIYKRCDEGEDTEKYRLLPKGLARYLLLGNNCYKEVFELHDGDTIFEAMKPIREHIHAYKTIPHEKMAPCMLEQHTRKLPNGKTQEVTMYRIEARAVFNFFDKMTKGNAKFTAKPTNTGNSGGDNGNKKKKSPQNDSSDKSTTRKRKKNTTKKKPVFAKPVTLTKKLKETMAKLSALGNAFGITESSQKDFCSDIFEQNEMTQPFVGKGKNENEIRKSMMTTMKCGYMLVPSGGGKYSIDADDIPSILNTCLTHQNGVLYDINASKMANKNSMVQVNTITQNSGDKRGDGGEEEEEDVGFDEESETTQGYRTSDDEDSGSFSSSEGSEEFSESAMVDPHHIQSELNDLSDLPTTFVEEDTLRSGTKRRRSTSSVQKVTMDVSTPTTRLEIESSSEEEDIPNEDQSSSVVVARVPEMTKRRMREQSRRRVEKEQEVVTGESFSESEFIYQMKYSTKQYKIHYDREHDGKCLLDGGMDKATAEARRMYIQAFQSMLIENDISRAPIKGLINFDKLEQSLRDELGDEPDFSDQDCLAKAEQLTNQMIRKNLNSNGNRKKRKKSPSTEKTDQVVQKIFVDILYAIYYLVALPESDGEIQIVEEVSSIESEDDESSSEEENPNAVVSPFLTAVNQGKSKKKKKNKRKKSTPKKKRCRREPSYCYFVGNNSSLVMKWLDAFFRHIFRNDLESSELFQSVQHAATQMDAFESETQGKARQIICEMFGPESRLPTWSTYYGTVIRFMLHLFPIHQQTRGFIISSRSKENPSGARPQFSFNV
ncbi:MAG: hypothetical protein ACTSUE_06470 [Promethearchaeota archaeon]